MTLTPAQVRVLDFVRLHIRHRGYAPSLREIGNALGIRSLNAISETLDRLVVKGVIRRGQHARSIVLNESAERFFAFTEAALILREVKPTTREQVERLAREFEALGAIQQVGPMEIVPASTAPKSNPRDRAGRFCRVCLGMPWRVTGARCECGLEYREEVADG